VTYIFFRHRTKLKSEEREREKKSSSREREREGKQKKRGGVDESSEREKNIERIVVVSIKHQHHTNRRIKALFYFSVVSCVFSFRMNVHVISINGICIYIYIMHG